MNENNRDHEDSKAAVSSILTKGTDVIFGLLYVFLVYTLFFTENADVDLSSGATWIGLLIAFALLIFVQKIIKSILRSIGTVVDEVLPTSKK